MKMTTRQIAVGTTAICLTALTACTSDSTPVSAPATSSPRSSPTATVKAAPKHHATKTDFGKPVPNEVALRKNVTMTSCDRQVRTSTASGTAHNPTSAAISYRLTVFYTTAKATDLQMSTTDVSVPAGASRPWKTRATFAYDKAVRCVLVGVGKSTG